MTAARGRNSKIPAPFQGAVFRGRGSRGHDPGLMSLIPLGSGRYGLCLLSGYDFYVLGDKVFALKVFYRSLLDLLDHLGLKLEFEIYRSRRMRADWKPIRVDKSSRLPVSQICGWLRQG